MDYLRWNEKIAKHFFNPNNHDKRIWFSVKKELIEQIANDNNTNFQSFMDAIKNGPLNGASKNKVCSQAYKVFLKWKEERNDEYPPYIAYLALFVLAANHEDDEFSNEAYYPRLYKILNEEPSRGSYPSFDKMMDLWADLQDWTQDDKKNEWGEFYCDIYGNKVHVGILYYQVVLTKEDRRNLPDMFFEEGWDLDFNPTEKEILIFLRNHKDSFSTRTRKRIEKGNSSFLSILEERILKELKNFDQDTKENSLTMDKKRGLIHLCIDVDRTRREIRTYFRCQRKEGLPNEKFLLDIEKVTVPPLQEAISGKIEDLNIQWEKSLKVHDKSKEYIFRYRGKKVKVFILGKKFGVDGWISDQRYLHNFHKNIFLIIHNDIFSKVQKWGKTNCGIFQELHFLGIPEGWHFVEIKDIGNTDLIKEIIPALSQDRKPRIHLNGGIRFSKRNQFFFYAPPYFSITGATTDTLYYSIEEKTQEKLIQCRESFYLPKDVSSQKQIKISYDDIQSKKIEIILIKNKMRKKSEFSLHGRDSLLYRENLLQKTMDVWQKDTNHYTRIPHPNLINSTYKIYLIGLNAGEIIEWKKDIMPIAWIPIWSIQLKRCKRFKKAIATFLGYDILTSTCCTKNSSKDKIKKWEKIVFHSERKIKTIDKISANKWKEFLRIMRNVKR